MEKHKKCKCGADAEWEFDSEYYCEDCLRTEFDVQWNVAPRFCEMCGDPFNGEYYTDSEGTPFCSAKCALEYNDAEKLEEEENDDESGN